MEKETKAPKVINIYQKLQKCRVELQAKGIKKTNYNEYGKYNYYDLGDFLPYINELCEKHQLSNIVIYGAEQAVLTIRNMENAEEKLDFPITMVITPLKGCSEMQSIGAAQTYAKKYLYFNAFEIAETDALDNGDAKVDEEKVFLASKIDVIKIQTINEMLKKTNSDVPVFLKYYKLQQVEDITNGHFVQIMKTLNDKLEKQEKEKVPNLGM